MRTRVELCDLGPSSWIRGSVSNLPIAYDRFTSTAFSINAPEIMWHIVM
jgi:hypothetical protein